MTHVWTVAAFALCLVLAAAWYLSYTAARLDRLHARVEGSLAALDAQLVRRADAALDLSRLDSVDPASSLLVVSAASACLQAAEGARITDDVQEYGIPPERAEVEGELTECLTVVVTDWEPSGLDDVEVRARLADACDRVELARRFHDEAVRDVRRVRAKPAVRLFRLAGRTALPCVVQIETQVAPLNRAGAWR